jgi:hypothetical protein
MRHNPNLNNFTQARSGGHPIQDGIGYDLAIMPDGGKEYA